MKHDDFVMIWLILVMVSYIPSMIFYNNQLEKRKKDVQVLVQEAKALLAECQDLLEKGGTSK